MRPLASFLDATAFLTRVPVRWRGSARRAFDLAAAAWAFPVVAALLGLVLGVAGVVLAGEAGGLVAAVVVLILEVLLTGALHLDGLADCADGCGGRDRESRLRIMKDHATGVYGVAAVVLALMLKAALVVGVLSGAGGPRWGTTEGNVVAVLVLVLAWTLSRGLMLPLAALLPYARVEGTGRALVEGLTTARLVAGLLATGVVVVGVGALGAWFGGAGFVLVALAMVAAAVVAVAVVGLWARRTLGGVTGDVLGAAAEVALVSALLAWLTIS